MKTPFKLKYEFKLEKIFKNIKIINQIFFKAKLADTFYKI